MTTRRTKSFTVDLPADADSPKPISEENLRKFCDVLGEDFPQVVTIPLSKLAAALDQMEDLETTLETEPDPGLPAPSK